MKPLPKWLGWLLALAGAIAASGGAIDGILAGFNDRNWAAVIGGISTLLAALSHSMTGDGGKPK